MKKVVFVGYMGSGKSLISKKVAEKNALSFVELDEMIEKNAQMSLSDLFEKKGELYFRKLEHQIFTQQMESPTSFVMSTGGGTPCYCNNHVFLKEEYGISIYLKASVATLSERLTTNRAERPLIANLKDSELEEFIAKHLFERNYFYHQAQHTITVDDKSPETIANEIQQLLF